jgi:hypothetical protein
MSYRSGRKRGRAPAAPIRGQPVGASVDVRGRKFITLLGGAVAYPLAVAGPHHGKGTARVRVVAEARPQMVVIKNAR